MAFFTLLAGDVRRRLAALGLRSIDELVGRADLLELSSVAPGHDSSSSGAPGREGSSVVASGLQPQREHADEGRQGLKPLPLREPERLREQEPRRHEIDVEGLLVHVSGGYVAAREAHTKAFAEPGPTEPSLNDRIVAALEANLGARPLAWSSPIHNTDRTVGARLAGVIAERWGDAGVPAPVAVSFHGSAGQSFGAFCLPGLTLRLTGEANDFVGKSMHGGEIVIRPTTHRERPADRLSGASPAPPADVLAGNGVLYGATGGTFFVAGRAGERFAVRNSGATAIVEGVGDHGCEYMTGGLVVVLGPVGRNFGAGMTGGVAYVLDEDGLLSRRLAADLALAPVEGEDVAVLRSLLEAHWRATDSPAAARLLAGEDLTGFVAVRPLPDATPVVQPAEGAASA
ncbi:MAG: hypothetical protein KJ066_16875 [Acidobacteria bacterium]|nr:hypothetical protein [Acidobacteriota bacterium]